MEIYRLRALSTNYIFLLHDPQCQQAVVIDPGEAPQVLALLQALQADLVAIWHTHHHRDHIGGNQTLLSAYPHLNIYASPEDRGRVPGQTHDLRAGDQMKFAGQVATVMFIPGHTRGHLAYYFPPLNSHEAGNLFCGDTLFAGGCGRLFEGTPAQMVASLSQIRALPDHTWIWCAHEYTLANLTFACSIDPHNLALQNRYAQTQLLCDRKHPTVPSLLKLEKQTNPFLRWDDPIIQRAVKGHDSVDTLAQLRRLKEADSNLPFTSSFPEPTIPIQVPFLMR